MSNVNMNIYDEDMPKKKTDKSKDKDEKDSIYNEIDYGLNIKDSIIYVHGDIMLGNLFDFVSKTRLILDNRSEEHTSELQSH